MSILLNLEIPPQRTLDIDAETRPLSYLGNDYTTGEPTALAASWDLRQEIHCWLLGVHDPVYMLEQFRLLYDQADMVTGHNIRRFDLPLLNGAMLDQGMPPLGPKLASDTYTDLIKTSHISRSQESLAAMLKLDEPKRHMTQHDWREANRLHHVELTRERVTQDVRQHQQLRAELVRRGLLGPPRVWEPVRR